MHLIRYTLMALVAGCGALLAAEGAPLTSARQVWHLSGVEGARLRPVGAVTLGARLAGADRAASLARGGDGAVAVFAGGYLALEESEPWPAGAALTLYTRVKPAGASLQGGLLLWSAATSLRLELAAWHMPWGGRHNIGFFLAPNRGAHAPSNPAQDRGWLDIVVRVHPAAANPVGAVWGGFAGWTEIFINGECRVRRPYRATPPGDFNRTPGIFLGRDLEDHRFTGQMDHLAIWDRVLTDEEVARLSGVEKIIATPPAEGPLNGWNQEVGNGFFPNSMPRATRFDWMRHEMPGMMRQLQKADPSYPRYHLTPPGSAYNLHAFHHRGLWHLFPVNSMGGAGHVNLEQLFWLHFTSRDLVHWQVHQPVMPARFDANGAFYLDAAGRVNVVAGDAAAGVGRAIAKDEDLLQWEILPRPVLAGNSPVKNSRNDPAVFKQGDTWYMVTVNPNRERTTAPLYLYRSRNSHDWEFVKVLREVEVGSGLQECLVAFWLGDKLVLSANKALAPGHTYLVGTFENETYTVLGSGVSDFGYNAQIKRPYNMLHGAPDATGRIVVWQWQGHSSTPREATRKGWYSCYSLPREVRLRSDHTLGFFPAREVERLRGGLHPSAGPDITAGGFAKIPGTCELEVVLRPPAGGRTGLRFQQGGRSFQVAFDAAARVVVLDIDAAAAPEPHPGPYRAPCAPAADGAVALRVFVDRSLVEIYTAEGNVLSSWFRFEQPDAITVTAVAERGASPLPEVRVWGMNGLDWKDP